MMNDSPPSYDQVQVAKGNEDSQRDVKQPQEPSVQTPSMPPSMQRPAYTVAGPFTSRISNGPEPPIHHYTNPVTGDRIVSLLPPDHPEMICLQEGKHVPKSSFGVLGVLAAVLWFPLGVAICLLDRRVKCTRCGQTISESICGP